MAASAEGTELIISHSLPTLLVSPSGMNQLVNFRKLLYRALPPLATSLEFQQRN